MSVETRMGRIWLHLRCAVRSHRILWHARGIARELAVW